MNNINNPAEPTPIDPVTEPLVPDRPNPTEPEGIPESPYPVTDPPEANPYPVTDLPGDSEPVPSPGTPPNVLI